MREVLINGKYPLILPEHRADRPEWLIENGGWEVERIESMLSNLDSGDLVIDVGTEEGDISALLAQKTGRIIMIEPNPKVWSNIKAIWEANNLVPPVDYFIGFVGSKTDLLGKPLIDLSSRCGLNFPECANGDLVSDHGFKELAKEADSIPQIKIDDLLEGYDDKVGLITIDVEGAEFEVVKGAVGVLKRDKPHLYISVHPTFMADMFNQKYSDLRNFVLNLGYKENYLTYDHELHIYFSPINNE